MVNAALTLGVDPAAGRPDRAAAFLYAPPAQRDALTTVFALDATLGRLARTTREPVAAQLRLAWWRDALAGGGDAPARGQPVLEALHRIALPEQAGVLSGQLVDGWEALVIDDHARHARDRGRGLFGMAACVLEAADPWIGEAGEGWAWTDLATTAPDPVVAAAARTAGAERLAPLDRWRASRPARPLGALARMARQDLDGVPAGSPRRLAALLTMRLLGR